MPRELTQSAVLVNQTLLLGCMLSSSLSSDMLDFLAVLQLTKMDLKFLDFVFRSRPFVNSLFDDDQFADLTQFGFESSSTAVNY